MAVDLDHIDRLLGFCLKVISVKRHEEFLLILLLVADSEEKHVLPFENSTNVGSFRITIRVIDVDRLHGMTPFPEWSLFIHLEELGILADISDLLDHDLDWPVFLHVLVVLDVVEARFLMLRILQHLKLSRYNLSLNFIEKGFFILFDQPLYRRKIGLFLKKVLIGKTYRSHTIIHLIVLAIVIFF